MFEKLRWTNAKCGHKTHLLDKVVIIGRDGETEEIKIKLREKPSFCHKCLVDKSVRCAKCGRTILASEEFSLCPADELPVPIPEFATKHADTDQYYICMDEDCNPFDFGGAVGFLCQPERNLFEEVNSLNNNL